MGEDCKYRMMGEEELNNLEKEYLDKTPIYKINKNGFKYGIITDTFMYKYYVMKIFKYKNALLDWLDRLDRKGGN